MAMLTRIHYLNIPQRQHTASQLIHHHSLRHKSKITIPLRCHIPLNEIPKPIQKRINKAEKYLNSLGVSIHKIQLPALNAPSTDTASHASDNDTLNNESSPHSQDTEAKQPSLIDQTNALVVGSIHQYPQITHYNQAILLQIFGKNRLHKNSWSFDSKIRENYNIHLSTALDFYPFHNTFTSNRTDSDSDSKAKKKKSALKKWKKRGKSYNIRRRDSFDEHLPLLTREYNADGDEQQLVVYRDAPYDINGLLSILPIMKQYEPDAIVFEYGRLPFFDKYIEYRSSFSHLMVPIKKLFAMILPFKFMQIRVGKWWYAVSKRWYKTELSSYAFESALDFVTRAAQKQRGKDGKIPVVVAGDLHHKITDTLRCFNDYLDLYNIATLLHYGLIDMKFIKASTRNAFGENVATIMQMRLYPHVTAMNVYRNDMLSSVINEIDAEKHNKILLVSQAMRLKDLYDKLCGRQFVNPWIKTMDHDHVLLNKVNLFDYKSGSIHVKNTYLRNVIPADFDEEVRRCVSYLGYEQTAFLLLAYPLNDTFVESGVGDDDDGEEGAREEKKKKHKQRVDTLIDIGSADLKEREFVDRLKQRIAEIALQLQQQYN